MKKQHIIIQRWFETGEGWAYDPKFPENLRLEVVAQIAAYVRQFQGKDIRQCVELGAWKLYISVLKDDECLDPGAVRRNPHIDIGILLPKSQKDGEVIVHGLESQARKIRNSGAFPVDKLRRTFDVSFFPPWLAGCVLLLFFAVISILLRGGGSPKTSSVSEAPFAAHNSDDTRMKDEKPEPEPFVIPTDTLEPFEEVSSQEEPALSEKEALEKEALEKEALEKEALEKEALEKEALEKEALEKEALEKEALEKEALEKEEKEKAKLQARKQLHDFKMKYSNIIKSWKFEEIKSLEDLIAKANQAVELRQSLDPENKHPDVQFLIQRFPEKVLPHFDEKNATMEKLEELISEIVKAFNVSEFQEIGNHLSFETFCEEYPPNTEKFENVPEEVWTFNIEFSQSSNDIALENVRFLKNCLPELEKSEFPNEENRPYFIAWMILRKIKPEISYIDSKSISDCTNTKEFIRRISLLTPDWIFNSSQKEDFQKELKGILEVWLRLEKRDGKGTQK